MLVAYDGGQFHGFATQRGVKTVQGEIEGALSKLVGQEVKTSGAGRTDAGVHALGQVISFSTERPLGDLDRVHRSLNSMCRPAIAILELAEAPAGFDARFSAISRTYEYGIFTRAIHDPFSRHTTWHYPDPLEVEVMRKAAQSVVGEHDFSAFGRVEEGQNPVRRIDSIEVDEGEDLLIIRVTAKSFLQQMVRSIVGTLVKVGAGKLPAEQIEEVIRSRDRAAAGPVAPAHGLFLVSVTYPEDMV
jgi:tRNA pseudouridine38-40 synthase